MFTISNYTIECEKYTIISFYPGVEIFVEIHDPKFFIYTDKDLTIPKIRRYLDLSPGHEYWLNVDAEYHELLDMPGQRCEDSGDYSLTRCVEVSQRDPHGTDGSVQERLARRGGCVRDWDQLESQLEPCTHIQVINLCETTEWYILHSSNSRTLTRPTESWPHWTWRT